jgi:hypothetical protein
MDHLAGLAAAEQRLQLLAQHPGRLEQPPGRSFCRMEAIEGAGNAAGDRSIGSFSPRKRSGERASSSIVRPRLRASSSLSIVATSEGRSG